MGFIHVARDGWHFEDADSGENFVPVGCNYCGVIAQVERPGGASQKFPLFGTDELTEPDGVAEALRAFERLAALNLNVVRIWLEPDVFFPLGRRLDPTAAGKLDLLLEAGRRAGLRFVIGIHPAPILSRLKSYPFEPPHQERFLEQLYEVGRRWGGEEQIFSWSLVGEGTLPWQTEWMASRWPAWLQYWYDDDVSALRHAWGMNVTLTRFADAPIPPRNPGAGFPFGIVAPNKLREMSSDPHAGSVWRYDWRLFMEEIGASRVAKEARTLREAGARQLITVGNNSWTFPGVCTAVMAAGYNPYFYLDEVDYLCQHSYPAPQCVAGGNGDPLDNDQAMQFWLNACQVMARLYGSLGKPVVLEEWGWYGGGASSFFGPLPHRSEEDQLRYGERMMQSLQECFAGWIYWTWRDMPRAVDISNFSGLYAADGNRLKPWGTRYSQWAQQLRTSPPDRAKAKAVVSIATRPFYTDDKFHEQWYQEICRDYHQRGPLDFHLQFERKPAAAVGATPAR